VTDTNGNYSFSVECGKTYSVRAQKQNTLKRRKNKIASSNGKSYLPIALEKNL
jgi:hypothetical protein